MQAPTAVETWEAAPVEAPLPRIRALGITKRFGNRMALRGVDLLVRPGERLALLGPNGAGKTTLLRILATLSRPTGGQLAIDGLPVEQAAQAARRRIGVVAHQPYLYEDLTAAENLAFYARMYDVPEPDRRITEVLTLVGLEDRRGDRVRTFSRGMQQRLALGRALLHRPSLLLLDEPDSGLDRGGMALLADAIAGHAAEGGSAVITTHDLGFGLATVDHVVVLRAGRVTLTADAADLDVVGLDRALGFSR
ncbi:MAG TPA: heme ABC exporter ATP-binding protein CcmA [Thermomicrobiaceae bacterium]|nr:heme ABC exporter ATP-binding protein CcmA [Thermomicrobiaceae bacterium]